SLASPFDMSQTSSLAAVIVIGSKAGDGGGLFAADAADLGHAHQNGDRCARADAVHAGDQIEPVGEIAMLANGGEQLLEFALQLSLEPIDLLLPECADTRVAAGRTAGLDLGDILRELLEHRQTLGQRRQTRIWRFVDVRGCGRAAGDQDRIDVVVLGMLQHELGVGAHLHRLEDNDNKAVRPQERNHRLLITPTCFDPNALDLALPQPGRQAPIARGAIVDLQLIRAFVDRHVQLVLAGIDPGAHGAILAHLRRPFLVMRTLGSFNHPGPMKSRSRSCSPAALVAREPPIRRPAARSRRPPGPGRSSRNTSTIAIRANTRSRAIADLVRVRELSYAASRTMRPPGTLSIGPSGAAPSFETRATRWLRSRPVLSSRAPLDEADVNQRLPPDSLQRDILRRHAAISPRPS